MLHARGCFILFADADGASEIEYLTNLEKELITTLNKSNNINKNENSNCNINYFDYCDVFGIAVGSRKDLQSEAEAKRSFLRNILMWGFHACVRYVGGVYGIRDTHANHVNIHLYGKKFVVGHLMLNY